jgi:hypothetical protein
MPDSVSGRTGADLISVHEPLPLGLDPRSQGELGALSLPPDPPLEEIRRRAFERAGLSARRSAELWSGLRHRAYWPDLELRFGVDFDRDDQRDSDEAFVSGLTRHLRDSRSDRGESYEGSIVLDWDLGGLAYPADSVDLSRELRQIVSLRDDVADELNQLYFERQRLRASLDRPSELAPEEAERLHWRAREIDAGLDAWTGGWVARWRVDRGGGEVEALAPAPLGSDP